MTTSFSFGQITLSISNLQDFSRSLLVRRTAKKKSTLVLPATMNEIAQSSLSRSFRNQLGKFDYLVTDGMPLVWLARLHDKRAGRVYGPDLMLAILKQGQSLGTTHYLYGTTSATLHQLKTKILERFPKTKIVGLSAPPFRPLSKREKQQIIQRINSLRPDFVWVSLGGSKQVEWAAEMKKMLRAEYIIPVGAAFDFIAGIKPQAPNWLQNLGFEWFFRLFSEPRRLWKRYLLQIPLFLVLWVIQAVKILFGRLKNRSTE